MVPPEEYDGSDETARRTCRSEPSRLSLRLEDKLCFVPGQAQASAWIVLACTLLDGNHPHIWAGDFEFCMDWGEGDVDTAARDNILKSAGETFPSDCTFSGMKAVCKVIFPKTNVYSKSASNALLDRLCGSDETLDECDPSRTL